MKIKKSKFGIEVTVEEYGVGAYAYSSRIEFWGGIVRMPSWIFFWDNPSYVEVTFGLN